MKKSLIILIILCALPLYSQKPRVAVLDFAGKNISAKDASSVSDFFRTDLVNTDTFIVLDRGNMNQLMKEQEFQATGCTDAECAVELGKLLSMEYMFTGTVTQFGERYVTSISMIGVETGEIISSKRDTVNEFGALIESTNRLAMAFIQQLGVKPGASQSKAEAEKDTGGGWGALKWGVFSGGIASFLGGGAFTYLGYSAGADAGDYYDNTYMEADTPEKTSSTYKTYEDKVNLSNTYYITSFCLYGVGAALITWWFFIPAEETKISYLPDFSTIYANGSRENRVSWQYKW